MTFAQIQDIVAEGCTIATQLGQLKNGLSALPNSFSMSGLATMEQIIQLKARQDAIVESILAYARAHPQQHEDIVALLLRLRRAEIQSISQRINDVSHGGSPITG